MPPEFGEYTFGGIAEPTSRRRGPHDRMRGMVAARAKELERRSRTDPSVLQSEELLALLEVEDWSVRMHLCRMATRVRWARDVYAEVLAFVIEQAETDNTFVRAWALDALATFAVEDETIRPQALELIQTALASGRPSLRVRAREGLRRLEAGR